MRQSLSLVADEILKVASLSPDSFVGVGTTAVTLSTGHHGQDRDAAAAPDGEENRELLRREDFDEAIASIAGIVVTHLSGLAARCSNDLAVRRKIDAVVY